MPDLEIKVELPEAEIPPVAPTIPQSENSSTALEVGRLMEQMRTMETQVAEANAKAETAEARAREAEATAEAARRQAEAAANPPEPERKTEEPAIVPVILEEVPAAPPAKKRGILATILLGR